MRRKLAHLMFPQWRVYQAFPKASLNAIEKAVEASERTHSGELRFVVEGGLEMSHLWQGVSSRQRAVEIFSQLRIWDTEDNSGVLIYVQLADRQVEILADRGINKKVGAETWKQICSDMENAFHTGRFQEGAIEGIQAIGRILTTHFPAGKENPNEMANAPIIL